MGVTADTAGELEVVVDPTLDTANVDDAELAAEFEAIMRGEPVPEPAAAPPPPAPAAPPKPGASPPAAEPGTDEPEIIKAVRAREQAQKIRDVAGEEAKTETARVIAEANVQRDKIIADAKAQVEAERVAAKAAYDAGPLAAINAMGVNKQQLLADVINENDPAYRQQKELAALRAQVEALSKVPATASSDFAAWRQQQEQQAASQTKTRTEQEFVTSAKAAVPDLYAAMEASAAALSAAGIAGAPSADQLLLQRGYQYAQDVERALGRVASNAELVQYVAHMERQRSGTAAGVAGKPTVGRVTVSRNLSGPAATERRSPPRPDTTPTRAELASEFDAFLAESRLVK